MGGGRARTAAAAQRGAAAGLGLLAAALPMTELQQKALHVLMLCGYGPHAIQAHHTHHIHHHFYSPVLRVACALLLLLVVLLLLRLSVCMQVMLLWLADVVPRVSGHARLVVRPVLAPLL